MIQARLIRKHVFIGELEVVLAALIESVRDRRYSSCRPHSSPGRRNSSPRAHSGQPAKKQKDQKKEKEPAKEKGPDRKEKEPVKEKAQEKEEPRKRQAAPPAAKPKKKARRSRTPTSQACNTGCKTDTFSSVLCKFAGVAKAPKILKQNKPKLSRALRGKAAFPQPFLNHAFP